MGIMPISNLLPTTFSAPSASAIEPIPMARVENAGRTGDDAYSPSDRKSGRGSEDDTEESDEEELEEGLNAMADAEPGEVRRSSSQAEGWHADGSSPVSFFA